MGLGDAEKQEDEEGDARRPNERGIDAVVDNEVGNQGAQTTTAVGKKVMVESAKRIVKETG